MEFFKKILESRSMTAIGYALEDALPTASGDAKEAIERMLNTNKLDEIYAIAHEQLGEHAEAAVLREFMARQAKRPAPELLLAD